MEAGELGVGEKTAVPHLEFEEKLGVLPQFLFPRLMVCERRGKMKKCGGVLGVEGGKV